MRAIPIILRELSVSIRSVNLLKATMHIINISNCTLYIVKLFIKFDTLFLADFVNFQKETAGLYVNN